MIEKLRDGFEQELKQGLIALQFKIVRELIEVAHALEAYMEVTSFQPYHQEILINDIIMKDKCKPCNH